MDLALSGKCALVTGASMGIGRASAVALAKEGVKLAVAARRRNLLEEIAPAGHDGKLYPFLGQSDGGGAADAHARARDERAFAGDAEVH